MKLHYKLITIGLSCLTVGALILALTFYFNGRFSSVEGLTPTIVEQPVIKPTSVKGYPARLVIPSLKMDLKVADGIHDTKTGAWTLSRDKVHFAVVTTQPNNQTGNTFIYGHYRREVFARLRLIKPGEKAVIVTDNGYKFTYVFKSSKIVPPTDGSVFAYKGDPQLTLQTCTGVFMQNRQLFDFDFVSYEKI